MAGILEGLATARKALADGYRVVTDSYNGAMRQIDEAMAQIGGTTSTRPTATGGRRRGRPPGSGKAKTAAGVPPAALTPGSSPARRVLSELPGIIARDYPNGATTGRTSLGLWVGSGGPPMSNVEKRLVQKGSLTKIGDRYRATEASRRATAA